MKYVEGNLLDLAKEGVPEKYHEKLIKLLDQINFDLLENKDAKEYIVHVLRYSFTLLMVEDKQFVLIEIHPELTEKMLFDAFDVKEFTEEFNTYYNEFVPSAQKYIPHLDAHAEVLKLFSENYSLGVVSKLLKL